jgi:hypothetical protein
MLGPDGMRHVSNSEIQCFKECRRRWYLQYVRKLVRIREDPTGPAHLGTRVHKALAWYYDFARMPCPTAQPTPDEILAFHDADVVWDLNEFPEREEDINKEADLSRIMLEGYFEWLEEEGMDEGLVIVGSEQALEYEILPGVILQGKLDIRVLREFDGARMVLDHKTVQNFTDPTRMLPFDEQVRTYLMLERLCNPDNTRIDGAIWNMLRKVKRTSTAKPPFYERCEVFVNDFVLRDFYTRTVNVIQEMLELERLTEPLPIINARLALTSANEIAYPRPTRDCHWKCPFFGVCPVMDDSSKDAEGLTHILFQEGDPYARYNIDHVSL